jgi:uracil-DNA glycosylase family 4
MFVGEQPGDQEDIQGHPFVGPAGRVLDKASEEVGIDRKEVYSNECSNCRPRVRSLSLLDQAA